MPGVLMIVDLQHGFLDDPRLHPPAHQIIAATDELLRAWRERQLPVVHVRFVTDPDGRGRLPHHVATGRWVCVAGSRDAASPELVDAVDGEPVFTKQSYSAFRAAGVDEALRRLGADPLVVAGLHTHACVRETALDAWERGYRVIVADSAVGSYDALHAEVTRSYLVDRGISFLDNPGVIAATDAPTSAPGQRAQPHPASYPAGCVDGRSLSADGLAVWEKRDPCSWDRILGHVPLADREIVDQAAASCARSQPAWSRRAHSDRIDAVLAWAGVLERRQDRFAQLITAEIGKPIRQATAEVAFAARCLRTSAMRFGGGLEEVVCADGAVLARRRPIGVIGIVTPWNNPVAIPAGKLGPALLFGNAVVWKPALECARVSIELHESLLEAGVPASVAALVLGGVDTGEWLIRHPAVGCVSFTGSTAGGRRVAMLCAQHLKPVQAELGGNNAAIIADECDFGQVARQLAHSAFDFAGQGCTATRRLIVLDQHRQAFVDAFAQAMQEISVGDPADPVTDVGPLISRHRQTRVSEALRGARAGGAQVISPRIDPDLPGRGCWLPPSLVLGLGPDDALVQAETFAPVAVVQSVSTLDEAIRLEDRVSQGLAACLFSTRAADQQQFIDSVRAGVLKLNRPTRGVDPDAPFVGWKESGLGPPEHGIWDQETFTRWQAIYRSS